jgi:hypothetical protein
LSGLLREKWDGCQWFAVYLLEDDEEARLRQVARREGYRTREAEYGDGPTTLMVGSKGSLTESQMIALLELAGVTGYCIDVS